MEEIIDIIHRNHGVAVIAHPGINLKGKDFLLEEILEFGIDGIETFSSYHSQKQTDFYYHAAQKKIILSLAGVITTGKPSRLSE